MQDFIYDYIVWITRGIVLLAHLIGFISFLRKQKSGRL